VAAGASFGLGFYTYLAYRFSVVIVFGLFVYALIFYRRWLFNHFMKLFLAGMVALVVFLFSIQLLFLGILGQYVVRAYLQQNYPFPEKPAEIIGKS